MSDMQQSPRRRRRQPPVIPPQMPDVEQEFPIDYSAAYRMRIRNKSKETKAKQKGPFSRIPAPIRFIALTLCVILLCASSIFITRSIIAFQEERRRQEQEAAERASHPLRFEEWIRYYAAQNELDPALVSAVILSESSFEPQAVSRLGARGLMQLMEDTASWVAHKLREDDAYYSFDRLFDPETNIRFGCWYLGYLSRRWDGDPLKIVCAYHAGQGNVDSWLSNPQYSHDGVTLDVVPTQDTAAYASRVLKARDIYEKYYFPAPTPLPEETAAP